MSKIARNLEKYDEIQKACTNIVADICILNPDLMPSDMTPDRLASTVQYMKKVNDIADELNDLEEKMNASDLTDACLKFIRDIEILTGNDIRSRADSSRRSLNTFSASLRAFNRVIVESTVKFKRFTASVTNAKKSLEKLDDVILKNEEKRNASLKKMGELIQGIADAVNSLRTEIENLDENKILRNFRAIQELLEEAKRGNDNNEERPQNNQNQNNQNQRTGLFGNNRQNNQNNNQNVQVIPVNARNQKTIVQFTFENVQFSGWMENKVI